MFTRAQRDGFHRARAIDIGNEPPLTIDGESGDPRDSRQVNIRWFAGTVLAGFLGIGLLWAAIYTSMDGSSRLAASPATFTRWDPYGGRLRSSNTTRKGDQIALGRNIDEARQTFRVSTTTKVGDRELVRTRPVTRITTNLIASGLSTDIPTFNPLAIFSEDEAQPEGEAVPSADGDVSYVVRSLVGMKVDPDQGPSVSLDQVLASVRDVGAIEAIHGSGITDFGTLGINGSDLASNGPMAMAAPNMTILAKTASRPDSVGSEDERVVIARGNERLDDILIREGATPTEAREITEAFGAQSGYGTASLLGGQTVKLLMSPVGARRQPVRIIINSGTDESIVALSDTGGYVAVADAPEIAEEGDPTGDVEVAGASDLSLYQSLYGTALTKGVPKPVVEELVRVFGYDADFQRKVANGDGFDVLFASNEAGELDGPAEVLFASLVSGGETRRYYRYQMPDDGTIDYFDESGRSARKFLMRKPISAGAMRSGFGLRRHPILGYSKMHTGVDWAAPRGTPIYASGNGVVEKAEKSGGYGNYVKIQHANGYETAYGHMQGFARGIKGGTRVRQGQLIGYVGSTGLSTGPHVHYEVLVNGRYVNPMRIKVPRGRELEGPALAEFHRERERIDALVGRSDTGTGSAQLTSATSAEGG